MIRPAIICFLLGAAISSCRDGKNDAARSQGNSNQLFVTSQGDTLETGYWSYTTSRNGVAKCGSYDDGFKTGEWTYKTPSDSLVVKWRILNEKGVKVNIPDYLQPIDSVAPPVVFQDDIVDGDNDTYLVLLRYDLHTLKSSVYDYLYQDNKHLEADSIEVLVSKQFKKYTFKGAEMFQAKVETQKDSAYQAISYIFTVGDMLYDLTYKNLADRTNAIDAEIFDDIFYSMECNDHDLFTYNSKRYVKVEDVNFR